MTLTAGELGLPLPDGLRYRYHKDPFFKDILKAPHEYRDFQEKDDLVFKSQDGIEVLCIPDIKLGERRVREIIIRHMSTSSAQTPRRPIRKTLR